MTAFTLSIFDSDFSCQIIGVFDNINDAAVAFYEADASTPEDQMVVLERCAERDCVAEPSVCSKFERSEEGGPK